MYSLYSQSLRTHSSQSSTWMSLFLELLLFIYLFSLSLLLWRFQIVLGSCQVGKQHCFPSSLSSLPSFFWWLMDLSWDWEWQNHFSWVEKKNVSRTILGPEPATEAHWQYENQNKAVGWALAVNVGTEPRRGQPCSRPVPVLRRYLKCTWWLDYSYCSHTDRWLLFLF